MTILLAHYDKIKQLNYIQRRTSATSHRPGMPQRFLVVLQNKKPVPPRHVRNSLWRPSASDKAGRQLIPQLPGLGNQLNKRRGTTRPAPSRLSVTINIRHYASPFETCEKQPMEAVSFRQSWSPAHPSAPGSLEPTQ